MRKTLHSLLRRFRKWPDESTVPRDFFTQIYVRNLWGGKISRSGPGSEGDFAQQKAEILKDLIREYQISSILDLGCGDFSWMRQISLLVDRYHGVDIVESLVEANKRRFESLRVSFQCLDLSDPEEQKLLTLKKVDLVVTVDVFGHLLNKEVESLLKCILRDIDARFFLVVNRRDEQSGAYLKREKSRDEGIDIELHPLFVERHPCRVKQIRALYPNDFFDLYDLDSTKRTMREDISERC